LFLAKIEKTMKVSLCDELRCPLCRSGLQIQEGAPAGDQLNEGSLICATGHTFAVEGGIPIMLAPQQPGYDAKMGEAAGWVAMATDDAWYTAQAEIDLALPFVVERLGWPAREASNWLGAAHSFQHMLDHYIRPGMRVLEIGAGKSWGGPYLVARGCTYHGCDLVTDAQIGLGRADFYRGHFGIDYEVIAADAEQLPFADNHYDLVYAVAALHHALDLPQMVRELARVTKPGGVVAGLSEGVRSLLAAADADSQAKEKRYGINEHVYRLIDYQRAFRAAGLQVTQIMRATSYDYFVAPRWRQLLNAIHAVPRVGDQLAVWLLLGVLHPYDGLTIYGRKRS
jgi:ubiquinone/menaquinone biosynthesis C-methylase UbiE/uncharacterized protein YbaR (Trm112 family)